MKPAFTVLVFLCVARLLPAQPSKNVDVPFVVMDKFTLLYPDAKSLLWEENRGEYTAWFKNDKMETIAVLSDDGSLVMTETEIKIIALPEDATTFLESTYDLKRIDEARITEDEEGIITFKALIDDIDYTFDSMGQLIATDQVVIGIR